MEWCCWRWRGEDRISGGLGGNIPNRGFLPLGPCFSPTSGGPSRDALLNSGLTRVRVGVSRGGSEVEGCPGRGNRVSSAPELEDS